MNPLVPRRPARKNPKSRPAVPFPAETCRPKLLGTVYRRAGQLFLGILRYPGVKIFWFLIGGYSWAISLATLPKVGIHIIGGQTYAWNSRYTTFPTSPAAP